MAVCGDRRRAAAPSTWMHRLFHDCSPRHPLVLFFNKWQVAPQASTTARRSVVGPPRSLFAGDASHAHVQRVLDAANGLCWQRRTVLRELWADKAPCVFMSLVSWYMFTGRQPCMAERGCCRPYPSAGICAEVGVYHRAGRVCALAARLGLCRWTATSWLLRVFVFRSWMEHLPGGHVRAGPFSFSPPHKHEPHVVRLWFVSFHMSFVFNCVATKIIRSSPAAPQALPCWRLC